MSKILVGGVMSKGGTGQRVNEWGWSLGGTRGVGWGFTSTEPGGLLHPNDLITEWDHTGARLGPLAFVSHHEEVKVMECSVSYISQKNIFECQGQWMYHVISQSWQ